MKEEELRLQKGASSNGYLAHIFRHMDKELFNEDMGVLTCHTLRNKDFQRVTLERDGEVLLCFEAAMAFRTSRSGTEAVEGQVPLPLRGGPGLCQGCLSNRGQTQWRTVPPFADARASWKQALGSTVFDMKIAADFSILESQKECVHWYCQHHEEEPRLPMLTFAYPGWV
ncbi:hypothetical protein QTO34_003618 [Cnephaeus nilssonii]|uniref:Uncharacterized protein n=1 Tax=Cnephaeus nilssonii TaxID=3371016 RepID=A0AA40HQX6_CNENI|nr:hypothetical protein QTO34_003618 [Eptesicus nilssonii]